jgi:hypothetical protein
MYATPIPLGLVSSFFTDAKVGRFLYLAFAALTRCFPTLLGYQFVCMAQKPSAKGS